MRSTDRRSSSGSASETDGSKVAGGMIPFLYICLSFFFFLSVFSQFYSCQCESRCVSAQHRWVSARFTPPPPT